MNPYDQMYEGGLPPWEIGRPQAAVLAIMSARPFRGSVLDLGCGTGENALALAAAGAEVVAIDASSRAIAMAKAKAAERGIACDVRVHDAFALAALGRRFDALLDSGLFHTMTDLGRTQYVRSLEHVCRVGTRLVLLTFSDQEPDWGGPRRVSQAEIHAVFGESFVLERIEPARFESRIRPEGARSWLAELTYVGRRASRGN